MRSLATISSRSGCPSKAYISRTFPLAIRERSERRLTWRDANSAGGRNGGWRSGDLVEARDDRPRVADVVAEVEDPVEVEPTGALVGGEQLAQRDALVPGVLSELLHDPIGVVAARSRRHQCEQHSLGE